MSSRLVLILTVASVVSAVARCEAGVVQVRDRAGGVNSKGAPVGYFRAGTTGCIQATETGANSLARRATGTLDLEMNDGHSWTRLLTYGFEPGEKLGFGPQPRDKTGLEYTIATLEEVGFQPTAVHYAQVLWSNAFALSFQNKTNAAAFQAILWELATDGEEIHLTAGLFKMGASGSARSVAQKWLGKIQRGEWISETPLIVLRNGTSLDLLAPLPEAGFPTATSLQVQAVPEVGSMTLLLAAGAGAAAWGRRRRSVR